MSQIIAIPKESTPGELRVAATPESVEKLIKLGFSVVIESDAGLAAKYPNELYEAAGAKVLPTADVYAQADLLMKVQAPEVREELGKSEVEALKPNASWISFLAPGFNPDVLEAFKTNDVNAIAIDAVPRISRAQKMDALSSMANIAGYRAVVEASNHFGRFFTGQITAAGKVPPAKVLVIGAGVAGLAAIGAAKSMGAIVRAFDTRPAVKDQVKSMGAEFLELDFEEDGTGAGGYAKEMSQEFIDAEMALFRQQAAEVDIIITTALIPGRPAPKLITKDMVDSMRPGSVVVDLAAPNGGNCEYTEKDQVVSVNDVTVIGHANLASRLATQASQLYANNLVHLLTDMCPEKDGQLQFNMEDEVVRGATVVLHKEVTWPPPAPKVSTQDGGAKPAAAVEPFKPVEKKKATGTQIAIYWLIAGLALLGLGKVAPADFVSHFTVFVLSIFIGWQVIWNVSHSLHTPLMSVTNAISGIVVLGALLQVSAEGSTLVVTLAVISILFTTINIAGGFYVTHRMLKMFRK